MTLDTETPKVIRQMRMLAVTLQGEMERKETNMTDQHVKTLSEEIRDDPELLRETEREWFIDGAIVQIEQAMQERGISGSGSV